MPPKADSSAEPVIEVIEALAPPALHAAAWATCAGKGWYFGNGSNPGHPTPFWKMDLDGDAAFDAIWEHARARCEELAGAPLTVIRQYANGHTYGLGGAAHLDDTRPGSFTLLYYPNPEWKDDWDGETMYYGQDGEVALAVRPRPNRGVFFDSRILHNGRAPSRACAALRVTVAYKLQAVSSRRRASDAAVAVVAPAAEPPPVTAAEASTARFAELSREGARRVYRVRIPEAEIRVATDRRLGELAQSVRLPGFRPGQVPRRTVEERYGEQARAEFLKSAAEEAIASLLPQGAIPASCELTAGARSGDAEFRLAVTSVGELPPADLSGWNFERLSAAPEVLEAAHVAPEAAEALMRERLHRAVLDRLDAAFLFPVLPGLTAREFAALWQTARGQELPEGDAERKQIEEQLRSIAERRVRLGFVIAEMARRLDIQAATGRELEERVIGHILAAARIEERRLTAAELAELAS